MNQTTLTTQEDQQQGLLAKNDKVQLIFEDLKLKLSLTDPVNDKKELKKILEEILGYPDTKRAMLHEQADRLGNYDIITTKKDVNMMKDTQIDEYCNCCGLRRQKQQIPFNAAFSDVANLGQSTTLFFVSFWNCIVMMIMLTLVYSAYSLYTNVLASTQACPTWSVCDKLTISLGGKQLNKNETNDSYYMIQEELGVAMVILWGLFFFYMSYNARKMQIEGDQDTISPSDFSVLAEFVPKEIDRKKFQQILDEYYKSIKGINQNKLKIDKVQLDNENTFFKIETFNIAKPFYLNTDDLVDEDSIKLQKEYMDKLDQIRGWIRWRIESSKTEFKNSIEQRNKVYEQLEELQKKIIVKRQEMAVKIEKQFQQQLKQELEEQNTEINNTVFITLRYSKARGLLTKLNKDYLKDRIKDFFASIRYNNRLPIPGIKLSRAPEPEDILWTNIGVPLSLLIKRKVFTFIATVAMLGLSFALIYGLSEWQITNPSQTSISIIVSICITAVNVLIGIVLQRLTIYQMNFTKTNYQRSLALKTILAQLTNSIVVTFLADYYIKKSIYEAGGLAEDIFYIGISNAIASPILKFIDFSYLIRRLMIRFKDKPDKKLEMSQLQLNSIYVGIDFQIGYEYAYMIKTCIFTSFFVSLQPVLSILAIIGMFLMYYAQKWVLFKRAARPPPGSDIVNEAMTQLLCFCPIVFCLGNLTWPIFLDGSPRAALIPNLIALGIAVFFFILPLENICDCLIKSQEDSLIYNDSRIFFTTEYDRLNPETAKEGYANYMKYIQELRNKPIDTSNEQGKQRAQQLNKILNFGPPPVRQNAFTANPFGQFNMMGMPTQLVNQGFGQFGQQFGQFGQQFGQPFGQSFGQPFRQPFGQSFGQPFGQPFGQSFGQSFGQPLGQPLLQPLGQALGQSLNPSQLINQVMGMPAVNVPRPPAQINAHMNLNGPSNMMSSIHQMPLNSSVNFSPGFNLQRSNSGRGMAQNTPQQNTQNTPQQNTQNPGQQNTQNTGQQNQQFSPSNPQVVFTPAINQPNQPNQPGFSQPGFSQPGFNGFNNVNQAMGFNQPIQNIMNQAASMWQPQSNFGFNPPKANNKFDFGFNNQNL